MQPGGQLHGGAAGAAGHPVLGIGQLVLQLGQALGERSVLLGESGFGGGGFWGGGFAILELLPVGCLGLGNGGRIKQWAVRIGFANIVQILAVISQRGVELLLLGHGRFIGRSDCINGRYGGGVVLRLLGLFLGAAFFFYKLALHFGQRIFGILHLGIQQAFARAILI